MEMTSYWGKKSKRKRKKKNKKEGRKSFTLHFRDQYFFPTKIFSDVIKEIDIMFLDLVFGGKDGYNQWGT